MNALIYLAATFCAILVLAVILFLLPLPRWKQKKEDEKKPGEVKKPEKSKITEIIKISAAGAIFLVLLYALVPEFIVKHHKEIIILVAAMIAGSALLGIKQDWEKSSTRKILKAHYVVFSIILILVVFYSDPEVRSWVEDFQPKQATQSQVVMDYPLCANQKSYNFWNAKKQIRISLHNSCWSGNIMLPPQVKFVVDTPADGDLEYKFWNGERLLVPDGSASWLGDISHSSFRLRGNGEAIITIERM